MLNTEAIVIRTFLEKKYLLLEFNSAQMESTTPQTGCRYDLPPAQITVDQINKIIQLLSKEGEIDDFQITLEYGGVKKTYNSVGEFENRDISYSEKVNSYSLNIGNSKSYLLFAGSDLPEENHGVIIEAPSERHHQLKTTIESIFRERKTLENIVQHVRDRLKGVRATAISLIMAIYLGFIIVPLLPGDVIHTTPALPDLMKFIIGTFALLCVRFRDWIYPFVGVGWRSDVRQRLFLLFLVALGTTVFLLIAKFLLESCVGLIKFGGVSWLDDPACNI